MIRVLLLSFILIFSSPKIMGKIDSLKAMTCYYNACKSSADSSEEEIFQRKPKLFMEFGYGLDLIKNHLNDNLLYKDGQSTYSGNYGSYGRGNIIQLGINLPLFKNFGLLASYIHLRTEKKSQTNQGITSTYTFNESIIRYANSGGGTLLIQTNSKYFSCGVGVVYMPKLSMHEDSAWDISYSDPNSLPMSMKSKGIYENKGGTIGLTFRTEINIPFSKRIGLHAGLQGYLINFKPDYYSTTEKEAVNITNYSTPTTKQFYNTSNKSSDISPSFNFSNITIFSGLYFKL